ncbi:MAG: nucleotidyltransferase domain-containing protein [Chitinophagales bacterium]
MNSETFGEKIRRLRKEQKLTQKQLAKTISFNTKSLSKIERNLQSAPETIISPLAKALNIPYKDLMIKYLSQKIYYSCKTLDYAQEAIEVVKRRLEREREGTTFLQKREDIIDFVQHYFVTQPVEKVWLFGSFARKEEGYDSDLDLLVRFSKPNKISLLDLIEIQQTIEEKVGRQVDLIEEGQERSHVKESIHRDKILIYEGQATRTRKNVAHYSSN